MSVAFSPDGQRIASGSYDCTAKPGLLTCAIVAAGEGIHTDEYPIDADFEPTALRNIKTNGQ